MQQLRPKYAEFLPAGEILPTGWLKNQLRIQADGLSGHLEDFWPDVKDSAWIGGSAEGWERGPYWLDGIVPLAYLLEDKHLIERVEFWVGYVLDHQHADGWLGPVTDTRYGYEHDPWPVFVFLKALTQFADITGDERAEPAMSRFFERLDEVLDTVPLKLWGRFRWGDLILSVFWLYDRTGDESLLRLAKKVHDQGFDWERHFAEFPYPDKMRCPPGVHYGESELSLSSHVVNNAMAVKYPALWARLSGGPTATAGEAVSSMQMIETLDRYHGQATGMFTGDEHLAGRSPSQGTELCAVAEYMYSMEWLLSLTGRAAYADRLETIAFNALPATFSPDMWTHQYDQQANQAVCRYSEERVYTNNGPDANLYGLDPNYGCCTANMHQAWPKFAASLWMKNDQGLIAACYSPCAVSTTYGGTTVKIAVETDYPFRNTVRIKVKSGEESGMKIRLRQPHWCRSLTIRCDDPSLRREREGFYYVAEADWHRGITLDIAFPMEARWETRYNESVTLKRGPLIYSLAIDEDWRVSVRGRPHNEPPHGEWEVHPKSPWNVAVRRRPANEVGFVAHPVGEAPFSPAGSPVSAELPARLVPGWTLERNAAQPPPESPIDEADACEKEEKVRLIPYGCTNLRITEFPWYED